MNVVSIVRSTTRWVELQTKLFRKFCGVDVIYVNHGPNHDAMQRDFDQLGVPAHRIPEFADNNPSMSHSFALEWVAREYLRNRDDDLCIVDMDIFPTRPTSLASFLDGYHAAGQVVMPTPRHWHLWPGLLLISRDAPKRKEIKLGACRLLNHHDAPESERWVWLDSGGESLLWIADTQPNLNILEGRSFCDSDLPPELAGNYDDRYVFEVKNESFFHLHGATNWMGLPAELHEARERLAERYLNGLVE